MKLFNINNNKIIDNMNIIKQCCIINNIDFPLLHNEKYTPKEYENILSLIKCEYAIFVTEKYFSWPKINLLKYFNKYNITYLNYNCKLDILSIIEVINKIINIYEKFIDTLKIDNILSDRDVKREYIKSVLVYKLYINHENDNLSEYDKNIITFKLVSDLINILNIKKIKLIHFSDNEIEPTILYKKISFSKEELFFSFDNYIIKKREYKLRTFCQIAEKLGAIEIKIKSDIKNNTTKEINGQLNVASVGGVGINYNSTSTYNDTIDLHFQYTNYNCNLNLNKFYIIQLVEEQSEFFIPKEEFESDIDFKFLIDSRCINLIQSYDTKIIINHINKFEKKV